MRETLFRGKRIDDDKWTYGYLFKCWGRCYLLWGMNGDNPIKEEVYPETVGQYTGLTDKNGTKIFEGDIIECDVFGATVTVEHRKYLVVFENGTYVGQWSIGEHKFSTYMHETWGRNVVGNKWDNSELLEVMR